MTATAFVTTRVLRSDDFFRAQGGDHVGAIAEFGQHFLGMLAQKWRTGYFGRAVRHLDRITDRQVLAAHRMVDLDHGTGLAQRRLFRDFLHR